MTGERGSLPCLWYKSPHGTSVLDATHRSMLQLDEAEGGRTVRLRNHLGAIVAIGLLVGVLLGGHSPSITAQNATPTAGATTGDVGSNHPAHIHRGTCDTLDPAPLYPLANLTTGATDAQATPMAGAMAGMLGVSSAVPVASSVTVVEVALADLLDGATSTGTPAAGMAAGGYAINVHDSPQNAGRYVACGDIGGAPRPGQGGSAGDLLIGLREQNASGVTGIAWLHDEGNGSTTVLVFVAQGLAGGIATDGEATPPA